MSIQPRIRVAIFFICLAALSGAETNAADGPKPLLKTGQKVDWWFAFKFNATSFPNCAPGAVRACIFGGTQQNFEHFSQQFVFASSAGHSLQMGNTCIGDTKRDPLGATFNQVYRGSANYVIWNDQFYQDPDLPPCNHQDSCRKPWGHAKGMLGWSDAGDGFVLQVTTPDWPGSGSRLFPRQTGNTLGCTKDNNVKFSQHFFALKLTKEDVVKVLKALKNASVVTSHSAGSNRQIIKNGGPSDIRQLVEELGVLSFGRTPTKDTLSSGVQLISKPSALHVPPWQMVSAMLGGVALNVATWRERDEIPDTDGQTPITCWDPALGHAGPVTNMVAGHWEGTPFGLKGGSNHAKIGVFASGDHVIFGDMNQEGFLTPDPVRGCGDRQNARGGLFFVLQDAALASDLKKLMSPP